MKQKYLVIFSDGDWDFRWIQNLDMFVRTRENGNIVQIWQVNAKAVKYNKVRFAQMWPRNQEDQEQEQEQEEQPRVKVYQEPNLRMVEIALAVLSTRAHERDTTAVSTQLWNNAERVLNTYLEHGKTE